ncbi:MULTISPECIES: hypothetical protein [Bacillaceae]|uniref:DUF4352 domain-containing protein n=1 Tax=Evansella alkalicola TaxID=745819 RepID=A0ABS6JZD0_9BACI|nr:MULTISPECIES: hypothetical protein [Bacillaceae]MBU9723828.1 hypothetical protein [Bacillus alkalicola]
MKKLLLNSILVAAALVLIAGCGEEASIESVDTDADSQENTATETGTEAEDDAGTEDQDATEESSADNDASEEEEASEEENSDEEENTDIGTRSNPLTIGERVSIEYFDIFHGNVSMEIEMLEVISGDEAWDMVREGNQFNEEPGEGQEYILAKFHVAINEVEEEPFDLYHAQFDAVSTSGNTYDDFISVSGLEPDLSNELYEGADREGYTYFLVDKHDEAPLIAYQRRGDAEVWFELRP